MTEVFQQQRQDEEEPHAREQQSSSSSSWTDFDRPFEKGLSISKTRRRSRSSRKSDTPRWMEAPLASLQVMSPPKKPKSSSRSSTTKASSSSSSHMARQQQGPAESSSSSRKKSTSRSASLSRQPSSGSRRRSSSVQKSRRTSLPDDMIKVLEIPLQTNSGRLNTTTTTMDPHGVNNNNSASSKHHHHQKKKKELKQQRSLPTSPTSVPGRGRSRPTEDRRRSSSARPHGKHPPLTKENFHRKVRSRSTSLTRVTNTTSETTIAIQQQQPQHQSFMEKLFGNPVERPPVNAITGSLGYEIRPRILLAATVYHNTASDLWITTINTNQRGISKNPILANKFLKAFSFASEREARESAIANAPPKMISKSHSPYCFCCKGNFAVFRRAGHCRNCGVCICNNCSVSWNAKLLPDTYNLKHEKLLRICISCNALSLSFKKAILEGDLEEAIAIYGTGNVNLRTPFPKQQKEQELMYPVHCAVEGGNLGILQWLIDDHFCPIKQVFHNRAKRSESLILTSKGRSVLTIALETTNVDMLRYLVVDCGLLPLQEHVRDLKSTVRALESALFAMPAVLGTTRPTTPHSTRWDHASFDDFSEPSSLGADEHFGTDESMISTKSRTSDRNGQDSCIICCDRKIDCVATPCGHQVCCLTCSRNLSSCPVCNDKTNFIKIFRP